MFVSWNKDYYDINVLYLLFPPQDFPSLFPRTNTIILDLCGFISESHLISRQHIDGMEKGSPCALSLLYYWAKVDCHV